jgi:hypothetical protein
MGSSGECAFCGNEFSLALEQCPHCGRAGTVPNVKAAEEEAERQALDQRYRAAFRKAADRGCQTRLGDFEAALAGSKAVINCRLELLERLASSDQELYASYYQRLKAGVQAPYGGVWDRLRQLADAALFPLYAEQIRFAALSLNSVGVHSYGECSLVLREPLIAHRASVFEENSAVFLRARAYRLSPGHRAAWAERSKLCVAKLAAEIQETMGSDDFPGVLLRQGAIPEEDHFIEVHVWGSLSRRTCERAVLVRGNNRKPRPVFHKALAQKLKPVGVELEVR